jgi:ESCRT-II complex subunit VPS25
MNSPLSSQSSVAAFPFPSFYDFPPFFTLQPNAQTRSAQLSQWSSLVQSYCRQYRIFKLSLLDALETALFNNARLKRRLSPEAARALIDYMASKEGDNRAEWIGQPQEKAIAWIWWRKPEEWAEVLETWVEETGQKGTVLTLYELLEGDATDIQEFHRMDVEVLRRSLATLTKRGRAQVFGGEGLEGVKFF